MMEETEDKPKGFKVEDRRRFSAEGEPRPEHRDVEKDSEGDSSHVILGPVGPESSRTPIMGDAPAAAKEGAEVTFSTFILSLSTQALFYLGEIADPNTHEPSRDLAEAQQMIDILGMLRERTRGNLSHDEEGLLDSILFDLRMKYVEIVRPPAR